MATLPNNVSSLSDAEKFDSLDALWADLEGHAATLSAEQAEELDRRITAYEKDRPAGTLWEQVKAGLPKRGKRNPRRWQHVNRTACNRLRRCLQEGVSICGYSPPVFS